MLDLQAGTDTGSGKPRYNLEPKRQSRTDVPDKVLGVLEGVAGRILGRQGAPLGRNTVLEKNAFWKKHVGEKSAQVVCF